uniref:LIM zinc-binding domain-containing protein n=1 Tax=Setaria digitata TaxID=48799 RepID=A0A915PEG2_9BILA
MYRKTDFGSDSNSISKIFTTSGLALIASNTLSRKKAAKWMIRCNGCNEPVTRKQALLHGAVYSLNKIWHREHFTCTHCHCPVGLDGRPFREYRSNRNFPICIDCYMEEYHPKCNDGEFIVHNEKPYDVDCYYLTKYESELAPVTTLSLQESLHGTEGITAGFQQKPTDKLPEKFAPKLPNTALESATTRNIGSSGTTGNKLSSVLDTDNPPVTGKIKYTSRPETTINQTRLLPPEKPSKSISESELCTSTSVATSAISSPTKTAALPSSAEPGAQPKYP